MRCLLFFPRCCGVYSPLMSPSILYLKPLRNINTFLHVIYKSKKKTNLLCILNNVFQYSKIRTQKRNAKKSIKTEKIWNPALFGIRNPLSWNPESSTRNPEFTGWNPESQDCHGFPYMGRQLASATHVLWYFFSNLFRS